MKGLAQTALLLLAAASVAQDVPPSLPSVVPAVQRWTPAAGTLTPARPPLVEIASKDEAALAPVARLLQEDLAALGLGDAIIRTADQPSAGAIFLQLGTPLPPSPRENEAYALAVSNAVRIGAKSPAGVFYGTRSLLQLLRPGTPLPRGEITDYPQYAGRMLMIDVGRKPFPVPVLKDFLRLMAWYKMNELHLHLSDESRGDRYAAFRIQSEKFPGLAAKDLSYSRADLRDLQDFARARGITITPEIDMPGHARCLLNYWPELGNPKLDKSSLDVGNPRTAETMKALLDEMIPLFDAPDFHIGTDEYRMGGYSKEEREKGGEDFRRFINEMNAFVRSKGKNCRIWSGFEHMPGSTLPDPSVIVDMWVTRDAKALIDRGHRVISSSDGRTYIVPGAHYYGVSNGGVYDSWEPWKISGDATKNPSKDDPHLLGGKLHIWNDQGPAGYTLTEIADLALPSLQAFAEKLWGTKGSTNYAAFMQRTALTVPVPGVTVFDRMAMTNPDGVVLDLPQEQTLSDTNAVLPLPLAKEARADLEYPWTLTLEVNKAADTGTRGVLLSSELVELCSDFTRVEEKKVKGADGKETKTRITRRGVGLVRAAGAFGQDPADSIKMDQVSRVYSEPLPLNEWTTLTVVAERGRTTVYVNGRKTGTSGDQMVCPLRRLGSVTGQSFVGKIRRVKLVNKATPPTAP